MRAKVLLLNQNYEPMSVVSAQKAIILLYLQKVEIIEKRDQLVRSQFLALPLPSVIRLTCYVRFPRKRVELNRGNLLRRDNHKCQYCGTRKGPLTLDHIQPKTRGGVDSWENLVCACVKCNNKKGSRTPEEAGMPLLKKPTRPNYLFFMQYFIGISEQSWKPYLYMN
ncbi:HNH endonuclease [candidate division KSB1 bacterium]|nr:HNH endonuclease [candidate division KSB1 bacterium]RQW09468.1 MAG: HNH endonuclease [candidate division KSB1 bacterium]